jgi:hypothetical protein
MTYLTDIRPPAWRLAAGIPAADFLDRAEALRAKVDAYRGRR